MWFATAPTPGDFAARLTASPTLLISETTAFTWLFMTGYGSRGVSKSTSAVEPGPRPVSQHGASAASPVSPSGRMAAGSRSTGQPYQGERNASTSRAGSMGWTFSLR